MLAAYFFSLGIQGRVGMGWSCQIVRRLGGLSFPCDARAAIMLLICMGEAGSTSLPALPDIYGNIVGNRSGYYYSLS